MFRGDSRAEVFYVKFHFISASPGTQKDRGAGWRIFRGILNQVGKDLLDRIRIGDHLFLTGFFNRQLVQLCNASEVGCRFFSSEAAATWCFSNRHSPDSTLASVSRSSVSRDMRAALRRMV